jgi:hypothetical protein
MAVFGKPLIVTPTKSNPNAAEYTVSGIFTITSVSIPTDDGGFMSSVSLKCGVRMADFAVPVVQGDWITVAVGDLPLGYWQGTIDPTIDLDFSIFDSTPDGQGGMLLTLKRVTS